MEYFSKEQMNLLKQAEPHFETAVKLQYKLPTPKALNELVAQLYEETTNETLHKNYGCPRCIFKIYEKCGTLYFKSKDYYEAQEDEIIPIEETPKKKKGRPKKEK